MKKLQKLSDKKKKKKVLKVILRELNICLLASPQYLTCISAERMSFT